jgi:hypothetical protein
LCKIAAANSQASHCIEAKELNSSGLMTRARRITALPPVEYDKPYEGRLVVTRSESQDGVRERSPKSSPLLPSTGIRFSVFSKTRIRLGRQRSWYPSRNQTKTLPIDAMKMLSSKFE